MKSLSELTLRACNGFQIAAPALDCSEIWLGFLLLLWETNSITRWDNIYSSPRYRLRVCSGDSLFQFWQFSERLNPFLRFSLPFSDNSLAFKVFMAGRICLENLTIFASINYLSTMMKETWILEGKIASKFCVFKVAISPNCQCKSQK